MTSTTSAATYAPIASEHGGYGTPSSLRFVAGLVVALAILAIFAVVLRRRRRVGDHKSVSTVVDVDDEI